MDSISDPGQRDAGYFEPPQYHTQSSILTFGSWVMRENRVPHWQREFQKHDGLRTWEKVRFWSQKRR
jgi:hypothetical protein